MVNSSPTQRMRALGLTGEHPSKTVRLALGIFCPCLPYSSFGRLPFPQGARAWTEAPFPSQVDSGSFQ